ncbi:exported hypothetical protein [Candidatus Defluviicoccus seviourii]|uniref:Lipoprotein n=1 Tax=Candidatus Defluviicoccus seviourii TaxID=2565273 RepID=A0A564WC59_9PROT|nr:exported hypothetical protein [Candidatus Defluviicoccus seviourii]
MRMFAALVLCALLAGCVDVVDSSAKGIWLEQPMLSLDSPDTVAEAHCARYGRRAVRQGQFGGPEATFVPVIAYDCR